MLRGAGGSGAITVQYVQTSLALADNTFGFPGAGGADRTVYVIVAKGDFAFAIGADPSTCSPSVPAGSVASCPPVHSDSGKANQILAVIDSNGYVSTAGAGGGTDPFAKLGSPSTAVVNS